MMQSLTAMALQRAWTPLSVRAPLLQPDFWSSPKLALAIRFSIECGRILSQRDFSRVLIRQSRVWYFSMLVVHGNWLHCSRR